MTKTSSRLANQRGMTLTELLVVSSILVVLNGLMYGTMRFQSQVFARELSRGTTQADLRIWTVRMVKDIRNAGYDPLGTAAAGVVSPATPTDFEFTTDFNKDGSISASDGRETMGYRLSGTDLQLRQGAAWRTVLQGVTSLAFEYYDVNGNRVNQTSPYTSIQDIAEVRFTITALPTGSGVMAESGQALIRNLS